MAFCNNDFLTVILIFPPKRMMSLSVGKRFSFHL